MRLCLLFYGFFGQFMEGLKESKYKPFLLSNDRKHSGHSNNFLLVQPRWLTLMWTLQVFLCLNFFSHTGHATDMSWPRSGSSGSRSTGLNSSSSGWASTLCLLRAALLSNTSSHPPMPQGSLIWRNNYVESVYQWLFNIYLFRNLTSQCCHCVFALTNENYDCSFSSPLKFAKSHQNSLEAITWCQSGMEYVQNLPTK